MRITCQRSLGSRQQFRVISTQPRQRHLTPQTRRQRTRTRNATVTHHTSNATRHILKLPRGQTHIIRRRDTYQHRFSTQIQTFRRHSTRLNLRTQRLLSRHQDQRTRFYHHAQRTSRLYNNQCNLGSSVMRIGLPFPSV